MSIIGWAFSLCVFLLLVLAWCVWVVARDQRNRGMRVKNCEVERERVTITLPSFAMRDFKERT